MDGHLFREIERAVNAIAQFKHGKLDEQSANPLRAVQILANVTHRAFGENAAEQDGSFTYKAVGFNCVLTVAAQGPYAALAERLAAICDRDITVPVTEI